MSVAAFFDLDWTLLSVNSGVLWITCQRREGRLSLRQYLEALGYMVGYRWNLIDLEKAVYSLERTIYEPDQFPGLIYRMGVPKVVILIFASGKLVCTGARQEGDVYEAVNILKKRLEDEELIYYE